MLYESLISSKRWEPIFDVRTRPLYVQVVVLDLLKQLHVLRKIDPMLPSFNTLNMPQDRQIRVPFGDMIALCDSAEYILDHTGALGVSYGGPDDKGLLWMKFSTMEPVDGVMKEQLHFIIWIDSMMPSDLALEDSSRVVRGENASRVEPLNVRIPVCHKPIELSQNSLDVMAYWREVQIAKYIERHEAASESPSPTPSTDQDGGYQDGGYQGGGYQDEGYQEEEAWNGDEVPWDQGEVTWAQ